MLLSRSVLSRSVLFGVMLLAVSHEVQAQTITNGDFSTHSAGFGQLTVGGYTVNGWTGGGKEGNFGSQTTPPVFLFAPNATGANGLSTGVTGDGFMGTVSFYGGAALTPPISTPVIAADGDPDWGGSISQTVTGLTTGQQYTLSFNWAGAQQQGFSGATTEKWHVTFGSASQDTSTVNTPSQQFVGWQSASMTFTPTAASQTLTFLAQGSPSGQPPWLLLNNVSLSAAGPEPGTLPLIGIGLVTGAGMVGRMRRRKAKPDALPSA